MMNLLYNIIDTAEVWALLIPLAVLLKNRKQPHYLIPVIWYVILAFLIDVAIVVGHKYPDFLNRLFYPNAYLYNLHSILRYICFFWFFDFVQLPVIVKYKKPLQIASLLFIIALFTLLGRSFFDKTFSTILLATEAGVLAIYSLYYYIDKVKSEAIDKLKAEFWVVTGLSFYVLYNFPCFLLFNEVVKMGTSAFMVIWRLHNVTFIILCAFIAKAFLSTKPPTK